MRMRFAGWSHCGYFGRQSKSRMLILWNPGPVEVEVLAVHAQLIHLRVTCKVSSQAFLVTFVYGFNTIVARRALWDQLSTYELGRTEPWMVLGDFNTVLRADEKRGGRPVIPYQVKDLEDCCATVGLSDVSSSGFFFTWTNHSVWSKLDRVMMNDAWVQSDISVSTVFGPPGFSDHCPSITTIGAQRMGGRRSFMFYDMWRDHDQYPEVVQRSWQGSLHGTAQFQLCRRLKRLKGPLKSLNREHFSHISSRARQSMEELEAMQRQEHDYPDDTHIRAQLDELRRTAWRLSEAERKFYSQKAKCRYIVDADRNTKLFHATVKRNARRNHIAAVIREDGSSTVSEYEVAQEFIRYYTGLLGTRQETVPVEEDVFRLGPLVSEEMWPDLTRPVTDAEIREQLFSIGTDRAPGPDGYTAGFFRGSWDTVGGDVCAAIREFFSSGQLLKQMNHTVIALLPKSTHTTSVSDYRPIACCNVIYKVIPKILATRMASILPGIIDQAQSAFVAGRSMLENIHVAQELVTKYARKWTSPRCLVKVDLRKAYDSVSWQFLRGVLIGLHFPRIFVDWLMQCVETASYSVRVNGSVYGWFQGHRGLRQGDPISPYLFVLCAEYLSRLLIRETTQLEFNFHPRCEYLRITHLAYADDLMLFSRGDPPSVRILWEALMTFGDMSGLRANPLKSSLYMAGICDRDRAEIMGITGIQLGQFPVRYLGVPLQAGKLLVMHYRPFIDRITQQIGLWTARSLSFAGRLQLIIAVLQGIQCFWLSVLPVPSAVVDEVVSLCSAFLWGGGRHLVAWADLTLPRREGGLGLRDMRAWNSALLSQALWNIHAKKDSLWVRWIQHVYIGDGSVWTTSVSKNDSPLFKRLMLIRDGILEREGSVDAAVSAMQAWGQRGRRTAQAYGYFRESASVTPWASVVWSSYTPPKYSFVLWLAIRGRLQTADRLLYLDIDRRCQLCGHTMESVQHLFFNCPFSQAVWGGIRQWCGLHRQMTTLRSGIKWLRRGSRGTGFRARVQRLAFSCTVYYIWLARNRLHFEQCVPVVRELVHRIQTQVYRIMYTRYPSVSFPDFTST